MLTDRLSSSYEHNAALRLFFFLQSSEAPTDRPTDRKVNIFRLSLGPRCSFVRSSAPPPSASVCPLFAAPAAALLHAFDCSLDRQNICGGGGGGDVIDSALGL